MFTVGLEGEGRMDSKESLQKLGRELREAWQEWLDDSSHDPSSRFLNAASALMNATDPDGDALE